MRLSYQNGPLKLELIENVERLIDARSGFQVKPRQEPVAKRERRERIKEPDAVLHLEAREHVGAHDHLRAVARPFGVDPEVGEADGVPHFGEKTRPLTQTESDQGRRDRRVVRVARGIEPLAADQVAECLLFAQRRFREDHGLRALDRPRHAHARDNVVGRPFGIAHGFDREERIRDRARKEEFPLAHDQVLSVGAELSEGNGDLTVEPQGILRLRDVEFPREARLGRCGLPASAAP